MVVICLALQIYWLALFGRIILSWFPISPGSALAPVFSALYSITEPVLGPVRRAIPPMRMGGMGLDLSPLIVVFGLRIIMSSIC